KIKALIISHGHEDHIGRIPFLLKALNIPVYEGKLAMGLIRKILEEHVLLRIAKLHTFVEDDIIKFCKTTISIFHVTHSISDYVCVVVKTSSGNIVHTGDFKFDFTPVGEPANIAKMAQIGDEGVLCLLSDSTNAEIPGFSLSEQVIKESIDDIFS